LDFGEGICLFVFVFVFVLSIDNENDEVDEDIDVDCGSFLYKDIFCFILTQFITY
jgi:hypothetical protein